MELFGRQMSRRDLEKYTGRIEQVAGIRRAELADGRERGVRIADVQNGGGLSFTVLLDRALDIGAASYKGVPLAYLSPGQFSHPSFFHGLGTDWLRNWGGGLLTGCGLRNVGPPCQDGDDTLPLHGRLSNTPAVDIKTESCWNGDKCVLVVEGTISERRVFGEHLVLTRRIESVVGSSTLTVIDRLRNAGFRTEPCFILYHTNWGFPMISPDSRVEANICQTTPRDSTAGDGAENCLQMQRPTANYAEKVYYHEMAPDDNGWASVRIVSPTAGLAARLQWRLNELPVLVQWKMLGEGAYVLGLEPSNCHVGGRQEELSRGPHCMLEPGETREFSLAISLDKTGMLN